ncbi:MAG TPA: FecR domain-containing protein, partial [Verrucomicrobiae bacterium]
MRKQYCISRWPVFIFLIAWGLWSGATLRAQPRAATGPAGQYKVMVVEGLVEIARAGSQTFDAIQINSWLYIGDRVRIGPNGKLTIQRLDNSVYRFDKKTEFVILAPRSTASTSPAMQVLSGVLYFLHRGKPELLEVLARRATAAVRGTEFELRVDETDTMVVTVIDGVVDLSNEVDRVAVQSGQQGTAEPGKAPVVRAAIDAVNIIQWTLYYPGILDVDEIPLTADERTALGSSIDAYRAGDLLRAVSEYPAGREPGSDAERVYRAGLFVAVGQIADAQKLLGNVRTEAGDEGNVNARLVAALRNVIAAVKLAQTETKAAPELASEWLAESYQLQSRADLEGALRAARSAVSKAPNFGFGWARVAELEFSFGRIDAATEAIQKSLQLAPRNPQAMALNGFLFAARNKLDSARAAFEEAIAVDGRLANAWLGRGLVRIRKGDRVGGREDLLTAAAMEPQRAALRSYLAKAWVDAREEQLAEHELELAKKFDEHDPTAWLYSALLKEQQSRINEGIRDLEKSQELNDNRAVYRSQMLLDQDRAVRSANLARLYSDAGLGDVAVREAGRGVAAAYGDYSSHVFLANSYEIERRANLSNFRFEAASVSENLIANLLGPANGRLLAQSVSQLNYADLFERDRLGLYADTEYFSRGAWRHSSAQFATYRGFSYSLEAEYQTDPGERINQDLEIRQLEAKLKYDLTLADSLYFHIIDTRSHGGDVSQHFDEAEIVPAFRFDIEATPTILAGYHHEWAPGNHTLLLAGRSEDILNTSSPIAGGFVEDLGGGMNNGLYPVILNQHLRSKVILYTGEAQQILTTGPNNLILGVTGQWGGQSITNQANNTLDSFYFYLLGFPDPVTIQPSVEVDSWESQEGKSKMSPEYYS